MQEGFCRTLQSDIWAWACTCLQVGRFKVGNDGNDVDYRIIDLMGIECVFK